MTIKKHLPNDKKHWLRNQMNHGSCTATGHYTTIRDTLHLHFNNGDIEKLTGKTFTFSYKLDHTTGTYEPLKQGFKKLKAEEQRPPSTHLHKKPQPYEQN
ncbi:MAG: hypothetical protein K0M63_04880 [Weeksellaceae bacterium]|nr:hypothetical protein [Weeksellaceae bacterium]